MNIKRWLVSPLDRGRAAQIAERHGIPFFLAMLLDIRGVRGDEEVRNVLTGATELGDPFLMKDMDRAVMRIRRAIEGFERIAVYGDYDADGVTSTAMLFTYLEAVGADVIYYIPQREGEGYGMNSRAVEALHDRDVKLIVTVDNGVSSVEEVALARSLGMDVVVTDHHRPHEVLPEAAAVVDAYRADDESPFKDLSGAGVALKLLVALEDGDAEAILSEYADLAALGTVGDAVSITGENRLIVQAGLENIAQGGRPGVTALLGPEALSRPLSATDLAFTAIPRLNATGRMGSPDRAVRLLCCEGEEEAETLAAEITGENDRRREVESAISQEAIAQIESDPKLRFSRVIVVAGRNWHHGVIGIVAARITDRYGKPCFVISDDGETAKGSGRSVEGFSLFDAVSSCARLLMRFGGHPMAAGVTLESGQITAFREALNAYAKQHFPEMPAPVLSLDCRLNPAALSPQMPRDLKALEPFGAGNPKPLFGLFGMTLREITPVSGGRHLRLTFVKKDTTLIGMRFGVTPGDFPYAPGNVLDLAVQLDLREFRGKMELTVNIRDMRLHGLSDEECVQSYRVYEKFCRGEALSQIERESLLPTREHFAALYRLLSGQQGRAAGVESLLGALGGAFGLGRLLFCLDVLKERGLITGNVREDPMHLTVPKMEHKVALFASPLIEELNARISGGEGA